MGYFEQWINATQKVFFVLEWYPTKDFFRKGNNRTTIEVPRNCHNVRVCNVCVITNRCHPHIFINPLKATTSLCSPNFKLITFKRCLRFVNKAITPSQILREMQSYGEHSSALPVVPALD